MPSRESRWNSSKHMKPPRERTRTSYEVLWAIADHFELTRNTDSIYESYLRIMKVRDKIPLERRKMSQRLSALKGTACGKILISPRRNWFEFSESIVRGYVRLRAEDSGVRLALDHEPQREPRRVSAISAQREAYPEKPQIALGRVGGALRPGGG